MEKKQAYTFEEMYDKHSPLLYGIILKISKTTKESEEILVQSFKTLFLHHESKFQTGAALDCRLLWGEMRCCVDYTG